MRYLNKVRQTLSGKGFPVFSIRDIRIILSSQGASKEYAYTLLHNMAARKEITRITRGTYTFHGDVRVVGFAFTPFYYGLEDALSIRGIWEQGANPVIITYRKIRIGTRSFLQRNYVIHRIDRRHFFGFELVKYGDLWIPVSDAEKTIIDFVYFNHYLRPDALRKLKKDVDIGKIRRYLKAYDRRFSDKVMGLL